jgi:competence protein ComEA
MAYREQNGPFRTITDLLKVKGIGQATLDKIKDLITVSG